MRNPFRAAREMGLGAFASMQLSLASGIVAAFAHGPLALVVMIAALSLYDLLTHADFALALSGYCVAMLATLSAVALSGDLRHLRAAAMMPFYWPLATLAALRALFDLLSGRIAGTRPRMGSRSAHCFPCPRKRLNAKTCVAPPLNEAIAAARTKPRHRFRFGSRPPRNALHSNLPRPNRRNRRRPSEDARAARARS